jgi:hypothetical protein
MNTNPMPMIQAREMADECSRGLQRVLNLLANGDPDRERPELHNRVEQLMRDLDDLDAEFQK